VSLRAQNRRDLDHGRHDREDEVEVVPGVDEEAFPLGEVGEDPNYDLNIEGSRETPLEVV
jgi:hypothetical protein